MLHVVRSPPIRPPATRLERYSDVFEVEIDLRGKSAASGGSPRSSMRTTKRSITGWIDVDGRIAEDAVREDFKGMLAAFERANKKKN